MHFIPSHAAKKQYNGILPQENAVASFAYPTKALHIQQSTQRHPPVLCQAQQQAKKQCHRQHAPLVDQRILPIQSKVCNNRNGQHTHKGCTGNLPEKLRLHDMRPCLCTLQAHDRTKQQCIYPHISTIV